MISTVVDSMENPTLFDIPETAKKPNWAELALSMSYDDREIIRWIMHLYNNDQPFDADVTYSTGRFWKGLPQPIYRFDLEPQAKQTIKADTRHLPLAGASIGSIMFDPPFVVAPSPAPGRIRDRFSCYRNVAELWQFYDDALSEFARVLKPSGLVAFKCQDIVSSGKQHLSHVAVINAAQRLGYRCEDLFVLAAKSILWSPNMANQKHARKKHSYFLVFFKNA